MKVYALAFGAHPDDVEMSCGGTLSMLYRNGKPFGIVDFTRGEMGTRGNAAIRALEAKDAAKILGADIRINLGIADSNVEINRRNLLKVVEVIRKFQPEIVFAPYREERHPDHVHVHQLVSEAIFYSGLRKLKTGNFPLTGQSGRFTTCSTEHLLRHVYVDISNDFDTKVAAIKAHKSQFFNPSSKDPETALSTPEFLEYLLGRMRYHGRQAGVRYAEPFWTTEAITIMNFESVI